MNNHGFESIAILMGGWSNEREVSLQTGYAFKDALRKSKYRVTTIDVQRDLPKLIEDINTFKPDVMINALHGTGGEDGVIQGVLTMLGLPFTHSSVLSSAIAMDKLITRAILSAEGIPFAPYNTFDVKEYHKRQDHPFNFPYVIKPIAEGSSRGVYIITSDADKTRAMEEWVYADKLIAEAYIPGREIQVAVMGGKAIGAIELKPHSGFYDYEAKYTEGKTDHIMPAPLTSQDQDQLFHYAEVAHKKLRCNGITRSDFRLDESDNAMHRICMLELNTQPGMTPLSLVPEIAAYYGISFLDLIEKMLASAIRP